jgi:hypothetical protein
VNPGAAFKNEHFKKIGKGMTSEECFEYKWLYINYIGRYISAVIFVNGECRPSFYKGYNIVKVQRWLKTYIILHILSYCSNSYERDICLSKFIVDKSCN